LEREALVRALGGKSDLVAKMISEEIIHEIATARILTVNGGSSSIKFALFEANGMLRRILAGRIEGVGLPQATFAVKGQNDADNFSRPVSAPDHTAAVNVLVDWIQERIERGALAAVGHRVVHGGPKYWEPAAHETALRSP